MSDLRHTHPRSPFHTIRLQIVNIVGATTEELLYERPAEAFTSAAGGDRWIAQIYLQRFGIRVGNIYSGEGLIIDDSAPFLTLWGCNCFFPTGSYKNIETGLERLT